jgi:hypothetical protein
MKNLSWKLFALTITAAIAGVTPAQTGGDPATLSQISNYRQWTKVNTDPVKVEVPLKIDPSQAAL